MVLPKDNIDKTAVTDAFIEAIAERVAEKVAQRIESGNQNGANEPVWLTMKEAAKRVQIDYSTIAAACRKGDLPYYLPLGRKRIKQSELDEWVELHKDRRGLSAIFPHNQ